MLLPGEMNSIQHSVHVAHEVQP